MNTSTRTALQYIKNTDGGATKTEFLEDHDPIGDLLWADLVANKYICLDEFTKAVLLTEKGYTALEAAKSGLTRAPKRTILTRN